MRARLALPRIHAEHRDLTEYVRVAPSDVGDEVLCHSPGFIVSKPIAEPEHQGPLGDLPQQAAVSPARSRVERIHAVVSRPRIDAPRDPSQRVRPRSADDAAICRPGECRWRHNGYRTACNDRRCEEANDDDAN